MMPSRSCKGVRAEAEKYWGRVLEMFLATAFSNGDGIPWGWLPVGPPGVFIHPGTLGGRLSAFGVPPNASPPARPPAIAAPPTNAPSRMNARRDVARRLSFSV